ncbi:hypothetical protein OAO80_02345 [Gammaproteobacteria bacterium]|nr:hypothetical protein [Gammaproteobacteria bacterium]
MVPSWNSFASSGVTASKSGIIICPTFCSNVIFSRSLSTSPISLFGIEQDEL